MLTSRAIDLILSALAIPDAIAQLDLLYTASNWSLAENRVLPGAEVAVAVSFIRPVATVGHTVAPGPLGDTSLVRRTESRVIRTH